MSRLARIHVNQHIIKRNRKTGESNPAITVKRGRDNDYAHEVEIRGPSKLIYRPDKPLKCGAVLWIETKSELKLSINTTNQRRIICKD